MKVKERYKKMKRRWFICVLCVIMLVLSSSCREETPPGKTSATDDTTMSYPTETLPPEEAAKAAAVFKTQEIVLKRLNQQTEYKKLLTKIIDIDVYLQTYFNDPNATCMVEMPTIKQMEEDFGIECLRKNPAGNYYSVHEVKQGGLLYVFYKPWIQPGAEYLKIYNWLYAQKTLSFQNFSAVKEGSAYQAVEQLDPVVVAAYTNRMEIYNQQRESQDETKSMYSMHYLQDGIISVFSVLRDGAMVVTRVDYRPDFQVDYYWEGRMPKYNGRILPQDYPR